MISLTPTKAAFGMVFQWLILICNIKIVQFQAANVANRHKGSKQCAQDLDYHYKHGSSRKALRSRLSSSLEFVWNKTNIAEEKAHLYYNIEFPIIGNNLRFSASCSLLNLQEREIGYTIHPYLAFFDVMETSIFLGCHTIQCAGQKTDITDLIDASYCTTTLIDNYGIFTIDWAIPLADYKYNSDNLHCPDWLKASFETKELILALAQGLADMPLLSGITHLLEHGSSWKIKNATHSWNWFTVLEYNSYCRLHVEYKYFTPIWSIAISTRPESLENVSITYPLKIWDHILNITNIKISINTLAKYEQDNKDPIKIMCQKYMAQAAARLHAADKGLDFYRRDLQGVIRNELPPIESQPPINALPETMQAERRIRKGWYGIACFNREFKDIASYKNRARAT